MKYFLKKMFDTYPIFFVINLNNPTDTYLSYNGFFKRLIPHYR